MVLLDVVYVHYEPVPSHTVVVLAHVFHDYVAGLLHTTLLSLP